MTPEALERSAAGMVFLPSSSSLLLFGGAGASSQLGTTWAYDTGGWRQLSPSNAPTARTLFVMGYDSGRNRVVLFGGLSSGTNLNDTWQWDGTNWNQLSPNTLPPARNSSALAYDASRGRLVMFGGLGGTYLSDTWEWTGTDWFRVTTATTPPARGAAALAFDGTQVVLFGGSTFGTSPDLADTWRFNGTNWAQVFATGPSARFQHAMTFEAPNRVVLYGGRSSSTGHLGDVWRLQGTTWSQIVAQAPPGLRRAANLAFDPNLGRVLLFGGINGSSPLGDLWRLQGGLWTKLDDGNLPSARFLHASCFDRTRDRLVLFGGQQAVGSTLLEDTWEATGNRFVSRLGSGPPARAAAAMAHHDATGKSVLFGGRTSSGVANDTWQLDGQGWTSSLLVPSPLARTSHAMSYDASRQRIVMFGGRSASNALLGDTWEWTGSGWLQRFPTTSPAPRSDHAMCFAPSRATTVLYGGDTGSISTETWEYDGATWHLVATVGPAHTGPSLVANPARDSVALLGLFLTQRTSELNAQTWANVPTVTTPGPLAPRFAPIVMDPVRGEAWMVNGTDNTQNPREVWRWTHTAAAQVQSFGTSSQGSNGQFPGIQATSLPRPGQTLGLQVTNVPSGTFGLFCAGVSCTWFQGTTHLPALLPGLTNSWLYTSTDATIPYVAGGTPPTLQIAVPAQLIGFRFYGQSVHFDPAANTLGVVASHGVNILTGP